VAVAESAPRTGNALEQVEVRLARDTDELAAAFSLVHDRYVERGYMKPAPSGHRVALHHALPTTDVFVARSAGRVLATATLIRDSVLELPADTLYGDELAPLRAAGRRVAEVSALAAAEGASRGVVLRLVALVAVYAARLGRVDDLFVTVNPRHAAFYERVIGFRRVGEVQPYGAVNGAPAVALRLDLVHAVRDRQRAARRLARLGLDAVTAASAIATLTRDARRPALRAETFLILIAPAPAVRDAPAWQRAVVHSFHSDLASSRIAVHGRRRTC
jgi:hypothetical protein